MDCRLLLLSGRDTHLSFVLIGTTEMGRQK
jgi:hypothetical protein